MAHLMIAETPQGRRLAMSRLVRSLSGSALVLLTSACATVSTPRVVDCSTMGMKPVTQPEEGRTFREAGFAVELPRGDYWCVMRSDTAGLVVGKLLLGGRTFDRPPTLAEQTHTFGAVATTVTLQDTTVYRVEDLQVFLQRWQQAGELMTMEWGNIVLLKSVSPGSPPPRFTTSTETVEVVKIQDINCVLSRQTVEERGNPGLLGQVLVLLNRNWYCLNPGSRRVILIGYSERYLQRYVPEPLLIDALRGEVEPFVQSLRLVAPQ
jgi:hypothetical protein